MTLAQDTDFALFDEPLNNLDIAHSSGVMRLLRQAADKLGKTVVVVIHDLNFASRWSDRIIAMRDGRVIAAGTPEEVMTPELLHELYGVEIRVSDEKVGPSPFVTGKGAVACPYWALVDLVLFDR